MSETGWIGVDLDGTLAHYDGWKGIEHIGDPVPLMLARVKGWLSQGIEVRIFTARAYHEPGMGNSTLLAISYIHEWCKANGLPQLQVTNVKDYGMIELWDDRAVQVVPNKGIRIE